MVFMADKCGNHAAAQPGNIKCSITSHHHIDARQQNHCHQHCVKLMIVCCADLQEGRREDRYVINALECQVIQKEEECSAAKQGLLESQVCFATSRLKTKRNCCYQCFIQG